MLKFFKRLSNLLKKEMNKTLLTAMHEYSHVLLSSLDIDNLEIMEVTLNPSIYSGLINTTGMLGLHRIKHDINKVSQLDMIEKLKSRDKTNVAFTGGMCIQTLIRDNRKSLKGNIDKYADNPLIEMDCKGCKDDMELLIKNSVGIFYSDYDEFKKYIKNLFPFALNLLAIRKVYTNVEKLSKELIKKDNKTLNTNEIRIIYSQIKLQKLLQSQYKDTIDERYNSNRIVNWDEITMRMTDEQIMTGQGVSISNELMRDLGLHWFARLR